MLRRAFPVARLLRLAAAGTALAAAVCPAFSDTAARLAAESVLAAHAPHVRVLSARLDGSRLHLDFSAELHAAAPGSLAFETLSRRLHVAVADMLSDRFAAFEIHTAIAGRPLDLLLADLDRGVGPPATARQLGPIQLPPSPAISALAARRIAVSPGHGYYLNASNNWVLQRSFFQGIVEDFINHDLITELSALLVSAGSDVRPTRQLDRNAGRGESGFPQWQEAARYYIKSLGAAPSIWNEPGFDHLSQDIRCRPLYANSIGAEILVSLHNNGGGGTGTETLYDTNNGFGPESRRLADLVHGKLIAAIRRDYNPTWADRRVQGFNGNYGENRLATRPAILIELAFMDRPVPDNAALQDARFRTIAVEAIRDGIREFFEGGGLTAPAAPADLRATGDAAGVALAWTALSANETGFRIERRATDATAWSALATVAANTVAYRDTAVSPGATYLYRIVALNGTAPSVAASNEATATVNASGRPELLLAAEAPVTATFAAPGDVVTQLVTVTDTAGLPATGATVEFVNGFAPPALPALVTDASGRLMLRFPVPLDQPAGLAPVTLRAVRSGHTASAPVTVRFGIVARPTVDAGRPQIIRQPVSQSVALGARAVLDVVAIGALSFSYQWRRGGVALPGATGSTLTFDPVTAADAGTYTVAVTDPAGQIAGGVAVPAFQLVSAEALLAPHPAAWLANVSLRTVLAAGTPVIVGFVSTGPGRDVLVRAAGPALRPLGVADALLDPRLAVFRGSTVAADNNDWPAALAPAFSALGAFAFPAASRDAAALHFLSGAATVQVAADTSGSVLIEGYDTGRGDATRLVNLSARHRVGTEPLIAGFVVAGTGTQRVLVRASGPALAALGVTGTLADPKLEVFDGPARIAENDTWDAALASVFSSVGAFGFPAGSRDAALVLTLTAGRTYTAQVSGGNSAPGEALVEVYALP